MTQTNDQRILALKKQIEEKKEKLGKVSSFKPITNCSIEFEGKRINLHTLTKELATECLVRLNIYLMSVKDLKLEDDYTISGYSLEEWMTDVRAKLDLLTKKEEEKKLKLMEEKLSKLLSEDKKVELEIDDIELLLKNELKTK